MSAIISECGTYRYRLERDVGMEGPVYAFFGVNPSTADASVDDATVRKWTGFVKRWGGRRFIVGNVFAFRATPVADANDLAPVPGTIFLRLGNSQNAPREATEGVALPDGGQKG